MSPTTAVVDDKSSGFTRSGTGWQVQAIGWRKRSLWAGVRLDSPRRAATWSTPTVPGWYDVYVRFPRRNATTREARYRVVTADGVRTRKVNQRRWSRNHPGSWVRLGTYRFGQLARVKLNDKTGERPSSGRRVVFDAVRFVPADGVSGSAVPIDTKPGARRDVDAAREAPAGSGPAPAVEADEGTRKAEPDPDSDAAPTNDRQPAPRPNEPDPVPSKEPAPAIKPEPEPEPSAEQEPDPAPGPEPEPSQGAA